ncbi:RDD family protein [Microtetraspora malaysiensis]|uniref:RDD family protein n=1 Tax=Microtetraspora malaysiensis TaxID=161358 RepID=UPI000A65C748|nr:RDD family protein [Microtetraspora malaysiensis]
MAAALRRVAATVIDYGLIMAYAGVVAAVYVPLYFAGIKLIPAIDGLGSRILAQVVAAAILSVPGTVWLASREWSARQATPGKRLLGLKVETLSGARPSRSVALARTALRVLLPWEVAHTMVWNQLAWPKGEFGPRDLTLAIVTYGLLGLYGLTLFLGSGRPPYDRLCATRVVRA